MSSVAEIIFQTAEAISAISLPVGGGLAAYAKWRKNAENQRRVREEATRLAADQASRDARKEERDARDALVKEKDDTIRRLSTENDKVNAENTQLHQQIIDILSRGNNGNK